MSNEAAAVGRRRYIDFWSMLTDVGADARAILPLQLGVSTVAEVAALLGEPAESFEFFDILGHSGAHVGNHCFAPLFVRFDQAGRLSCIGFGEGQRTDTICGAVETAVAGYDIYGDRKMGTELHFGEQAVIRMAGRRLDEFATLPRFLNYFGDLQPFELSAWPKDKVVTIKRKTELGNLYAKFLLSAFKTPYIEHFQFDYCLANLTIQSNDDDAS